MTQPERASSFYSGSDVAGVLRSDFLDFAATLIQSAFRGYVQRKSYKALVCFQNIRYCYASISGVCVGMCSTRLLSWKATCLGGS